MLNSISNVLVVALAVSSVVAFPILFKRAGLAWWHALIPVLNDYEWMGVTWTRGAFVRRLVGYALLAASLFALHSMGALTVDAQGGSFAFNTPFTLQQSLVGLVACASLVWTTIMQLEANWYAADAFDGTLATFLGLSCFGGIGYLWMAIRAARGDREYLGDLDSRIAAEEALYGHWA